MAIVFFPDPMSMVARGLGRVKHVPSLFAKCGRYLREQSRYLRERALLVYRPSPSSGDFPREATLRTIAAHLANFDKWTDLKKLDWREIEYAAVIDYQNEQLSGAWSRTGEPLEPQTANARADEVTHFLHWAALNGLRPQFNYETKIKERFIAGKLRSFTIRVGRAPEATMNTDTSVSFPSAKEVKAWLEAVRARRGEAKYLACRFVIETGARKSEVAKAKVSDWPTRTAIEAAVSAGSAFVMMKLKHGTKGGKPRSIKIPVGFALLVSNWLKRRDTYAYLYFKRTRKHTDRLFLSDSGEHAGTPLSGNTIWRCFHEVEPRPEGWTTHKGRHAYAVFLVIYALEKEAKVAGGSLKTMETAWIRDRGSHWLDLVRRQFGHVSTETTQIYLKWLITTAGLSQIAAGWHEYLNGEDAE